MPDNQTSDEERRLQWQRAREELNARYDHIDERWQKPIQSGFFLHPPIPLRVLDTPEWESGWRVLLEWLNGHGFYSYLPDRRWERFQPFAKACWGNEIHIFSHALLLGEGHTLAHAALEEEGQRLILDWWCNRRSHGA